MSKQIDISTPKYPDTFTIVDDELFDYLNQWKWRYMETGMETGGAYVVRTTSRRIKPRKIIYIHREIMKDPKGLMIDHVDGNTLNNTASNLRVCTNSQNQMNRKPTTYTSSIYKGVNWDKSSQKWLSRLSFKGKCIYLGLFAYEKQAAHAYNKKAQQLFGEFACLNNV